MDFKWKTFIIACLCRAYGKLELFLVDACGNNRVVSGKYSLHLEKLWCYVVFILLEYFQNTFEHILESADAHLQLIFTPQYYVENTKMPGLDFALKGVLKTTDLLQPLPTFPLHIKSLCTSRHESNLFYELHFTLCSSFPVATFTTARPHSYSVVLYESVPPLCVNYSLCQTPLSCFCIV